MDVKVSAVIAAAGKSLRMGGIDKQLADIYGVSVLARTVEAFEKCPLITETVIVTREEQFGIIKNTLSSMGARKVKEIVSGGESRQSSVFNGVKALSYDTDYIAVHDGARPFITPEEIERCLYDAEKYGAAALGVRAKDTIKIIDGDGFVVFTPNRDFVWHAQTPQIFKAELYRKAMEKAKADGKEYSDDCGLVEACGVKVYMSEGSYENIKITTPYDLILARNIARGREKE